MRRPSGRNRRQYEPQTRVNRRIRAREVRVVAADGKQLGVMATEAAIKLAQQQGVDLVEVAPAARPPVCRIIDFGRYRYEQSKKKKENKKNQHANKLKEVQLSVKIDKHDFDFKLEHAAEFLCHEMKVKVTLRFKGREMAHTEVGFEVVNSFLEKIGPWGHPDSPAKMIGRGIIVLISPLPKSKRAANPRGPESRLPLDLEEDEDSSEDFEDDQLEDNHLDDEDLADDSSEEEHTAEEEQVAEEPSQRPAS